MADDIDATTIAEEGGGNQGGKKGSPIIIYIAIAVIMAVAGYFLGGGLGGGGGEEPESAQHEEHQEESHDSHGSSDSHGGSSGHDASTGSSDIFMMEDIIVNPAETGGTRFLSVSIGFDVGSGKTASMLKEREAIIKDALITILSSKTISQLSDPKEKEITRYQIKKRVEHILSVEDIAAVYFTDYILQ